MKYLKLFAFVVASFGASMASFASAEGFKIKGIDTEMSLQEALASVQAREGNCLRTGWDLMPIGGTGESHQCWFGRKPEPSLRFRADLILVAKHFGDQLHFSKASFSCSYTDTCGMKIPEIVEALVDAAVLPEAALSEIKGPQDEFFYSDRSGSISIHYSFNLLRISIAPVEENKYRPSFE